MGCALAAPAPYDNPPKSGTVQEISKYHVTAENKNSPAAGHATLHQSESLAHQTPVHRDTVKEETHSATKSTPIETHSDSYGDKIKKIEGPTPVPSNAQPSIHSQFKRDAAPIDEPKKGKLPAPIPAKPQPSTTSRGAVKAQSPPSPPKPIAAQAQVKPQTSTTSRGTVKAQAPPSPPKPFRNKRSADATNEETKKTEGNVKKVDLKYKPIDTTASSKTPIRAQPDAHTQIKRDAANTHEETHKGTEHVRKTEEPDHKHDNTCSHGDLHKDEHKHDKRSADATKDEAKNTDAKVIRPNIKPIDTAVPKTSTKAQPEDHAQIKRNAANTREEPKNKENLRKTEELKNKPVAKTTTVASPAKVQPDTPAKITTNAQTAIHRNKRSADHNPVHTLEENKKKDDEKVNHEHKLTSEDVKQSKISHSIVAKRENIPAKADQNQEPLIHVPAEQTHKYDTHRDEDDHKQEKRGIPTPTPVSDLKVKPVPATVHQHVTKEALAVENKPKKIDENLNSKPIVKREDVTTETAPASTTHAAHHLVPTAVHSTFSQTWTRPQAHPAEVEKTDDKVPAASDNKPVLASIDPFKAVQNEKFTTTTTTTTVAPSTTAASHIRVRRGNDETESQEEPKEPKPTKAWWRSLDFNSKKDEEKKPETSTVAHKDVVTQKSVVAAPSSVLTKDKVTQKREANDSDKKTTTVSPSTTTNKNRQSDLSAPEYDTKPPQFVHPVPVSQILGQKQA